MSEDYMKLCLVRDRLAEMDGDIADGPEKGMRNEGG